MSYLSPAELAILWLANSTNDKETDTPVVLASNSTLTLMIVLANGIANLADDKIAERALKVIENYSRELVTHLKNRGGYIRYDQPVKKLLESLDDIGFPIIPDNYIVLEKNEKRSEASLSYELANKEYEVALRKLEADELLIDPPWYKTKLVAVPLIVLLGSVPLEINIKTAKGEAVTTKISAKFWDYENNTLRDSSETIVNIKIAKFIDTAIKNLSSGFAQAWSDENPERINNLKSEIHSES